jgi:2-oxoisovalerate dehydrogenase E1 component
MNDLLSRLGKDMLFVRRLEEFILELFSAGQLNGTTHAYIGQEAVAAGLFDHLDENDTVFSNHRCHAHYLLHQHDPVGLLAELMGRQGGTCGGVGGSQHLHRGRFYSNGVQGGIAPALVGLTWAARYKGEAQGIGVVFLGDGTLGQGQVYEAFNLASLWGLPVLFVIEHNGYSQSTPSHLQIAGEVGLRPQAFGIPLHEVASNDVVEVHQTAGAAVQFVRTQRKPAALLCHTFRLCSHSKSDDARPEELIAPWREKDPLLILRPRLGEAAWEALELVVAEEVSAAYALAEASPPAEEWNLSPLPLPAGAPWPVEDGKIVKLLNAEFHRLLAERSEVIAVGMDILDPYGGAFKVEKGLSTAFPAQVLPTPVCETSLTGLCGGMALGGLRPILQIMFGDFLTLGVEPLVNYISKYRGMYNDSVRCPVVVRAAMGGGRGYGPTHSQCLEKLLLGIPDVRLVALSSFHHPGALLRAAVDDEAPVLLVENKQVYTRNFQASYGLFSRRIEGLAYPTLTFSPNDFRFSDAVVAVYGGMVELALEAAEELMEEHELAVEVVAYSLIYPPPLGPLSRALGRAQGRLVTLEEGVLGGGWGAELVASAGQRGWVRASARVGARETVIPSARAMENQVLPSRAQLVAALRKLIH